jgi:hypothetical protein
MARQQITAGSAPLVWSAVSDAFDKINANFSELYITVGGGEPFDFTQITTSLIPAANTEYDIGSGSKRWKTGYFSTFGISIGGAIINSEDGLTLNLPSGTKVDGELIRNPDESSFKTFAVVGQDDVVANNFTGIVTLANGGGISITTNGATDTITITNSGVTAATAGTGLSISAGTGAVTFTNTGVTSVTAGSGITVSAATGGITVSNSGVLSVVTDSGSGIGLDTSVPGIVRISNTLPSTLINAFRLIAVSGEVNVSAQNSADTLTLIKGTGIDIETTLNKEITFTNIGVTALATSGQGLSVNASTGSITINFDNRIDIVGSVFADNSTMLVDGTQGVLRGEHIGTLTGTVTGSVIGNVTGDVTGTVFGTLEGYHLGDQTGSVFGDDSTKLIDAVESKIVGPVDTVSVSTGKIEETFEGKSSATGTVIHNCSATQIFFHTSIGSDFTANFTNLDLESGKITSVTLILNQGGTAYIPTAVQIGGIAQVILWQGSAPPIGNNNKTDIVEFSIVNDVGVYYVYGQLTTFGI